MQSQVRVDKKEPKRSVDFQAPINENGAVDMVAQVDGIWITKVIIAEGRMTVTEMLKSVPGVNLLHPLLVPTFRRGEWIDLEREGNEKAQPWVLKLERSDRDNVIDLVSRRGIVHAICRRDDDELMLCINADQTVKDRPTKFSAESGTETIVLICERSDAKGRERLKQPVAFGVVFESPSLREISEKSLKALDKLGLEKMERIFTAQIHMCAEEGPSLKEFSQQFVRLGKKLDSRLIGRFDTWSGRGPTDSFRRLVFEPVDRHASHLQRDSDAYKLAVTNMTKQLELIRKHRHGMDAR